MTVFIKTVIGAARIVGATASADQVAAQISLRNHASGGGLFRTTSGSGGTVTFENGVQMELLSNSALGDSDDSMTWQFEDDAVINGNGNHFDLQHGVLKIKSGKTLELRDMVVDNLVTASFLDDSSYAGTLKLSNVTVILQSSVNWAAVDGNLTIDGPTTFITGASKFTPPTTGGTSTINGVTVWYDTLGQPDSGNISGNDFGGTGRVSSLDSSVASLEFTSSANEIAQSYHLTPVDYATDADGAQNTSGTVGGVQAAFTGGDTFVFDGHGRTLYLADVTNTANASSDKGLIKVSGDTTVKSAHVTIDGFQEAAITRNAATDFFNFDVGTVLRLQSDQALTTSYSFGNDSNIDRDSGTYTVLLLILMTIRLIWLMQELSFASKMRAD